MQNGIGHAGVFVISRVYPDGHVEERQRIKNVIVQNGLNMIAQLLGGSAASISYFAWGSGGLSSGSVVSKVLASSGLTTQDGSLAVTAFARVTNQATFSCLMAAGDGNSPGTINEFGLAASGTTLVNNFYAMQAFQPENKTNAFALQFEYTITSNNSA